MELIKHKIGEFVELLSETNADLLYGIDDVRGVNNLKQLMATKADLTSRDLTKFQIVRPGSFVFNHRTSRNGDKFSIAYNDGDNPVICTEDYVVFKVKEESKTVISEEWLFLYFNRPEFDRYVITNSWGSSTEFFNWEDICDVEIELPPLEIQKKYVNIYRALLLNQKGYDAGIEDLKLTVDAVIEKFKFGTRKISLGDLVFESDERNVDGKSIAVNGVNKEKMFISSVARGADLTKYKLVRKKQFACNLMHVGRDVAVPVSINLTDETMIVSPAYLVFDVDNNVVLPEFLLMWLSRKETDRYAWFMSDTNVRSGMEKKRFYELEIPVPNIEIQRDVIEIYNAYIMRKEINERLKAQIKDLCPILIKGSIEEARK